MFVQGQVYLRKDIHSRFGGQVAQGISTPSRNKFILLFSGESGRQYGYFDGWSDDGIFLYTGEGQYGDMEFKGGNKAIRDHQENGKDLHLFEQMRHGNVRYVGQMICAGFHLGDGPDITGKERSVIHFELVPTSTFDDDSYLSLKQTDDVSLPELSLESLRSKALEDSSANRPAVDRVIAYRRRSVAIKLYAKKRANGVCEGCGTMAPFRTKSGNPFLVVHHIRSLSDAGPDDPRFVIAMCPNCHERAHHSEDAEKFNRLLESIVQEKEQLT
jgi:5-methylcytosine-specific restriction protein A